MPTNRLTTLIFVLAIGLVWAWIAIEAACWRVC